MNNNQWLRRIELLLSTQDHSKFIDLSQFHIKFSVGAEDLETPNTCEIRLYNLAKETAAYVLTEFNTVTLNAGYIGGSFGSIFQGTIKQVKFGRENATDTYVDIYASDGDVVYLNGTVVDNIPKGKTLAETVQKVAGGMQQSAAEINAAAVNISSQADMSTIVVDSQHFPQIRGQVLFGMGKSVMRNLANTLEATWSIQNGRITLLNRTAYTNDPPVDINVATGLIGLPEQTDEGIKVQSLLNPLIRIGGRINLNNKEIVQTMQQNPNAAPIQYNQRTGFQYMAALANSPGGFYRAYAISHEGDTRGNPWYTHLTCLAVSASAPQSSSVPKT